MNEAALRAYFSEPMGNASIPPEKFVAQPYEMYSERGELITVTPLQPLQYKHLGLGAMIRLQEQLIEHSEAADMDERYKHLAELEKRQMALEVLLKAKKLEIPDPEFYRHPVLPWGWEETWERLKIAFPRKSQSEMSHGGKSQTGEGKKKVRKFRKISPKPRKIKS